MNASLGRALLTASVLCSAACNAQLSAQASTLPPTATTAATPTQATGTSAPQKPSALIAPAVDHLSQVVSQIQLERWKGSSRDETDSNLRSVERNISSTLPQLVTAADAQPSSVAASLPLLRNLDALCAVVIRVSVTARGNAPTPQAESIAGALTALQSARNTLADQLQTIAAAQEKQISTLNTTVTTLTAKLNAPPPPTPLAPSTKPKPRARKKAAPKPTAAPTSPTSSPRQ